jgi:hypothetical protein
MQRYLVNKNAQSNGDHEMHVDTCSHLPNPENRLYLGFFSGCREALKEAKKYDSNADGCFFCCNACHTS